MIEMLLPGATHRILFPALAAILALTCGQASASIIASSTFDSDLDGWTSNTPAQIAWQSSGGNPGGYILFTDATPDNTVILAPSNFLGDYLSSGIASISFDDDIEAETGVGSVRQYEIGLSGPGGSATFFGSQPSTSYPTGWVNVLAPISGTVAPPAGWTMNSGTWLGLLNDVTELQIPIELVTNRTVPGDTDLEGVDNVVLSGAPEPGTVALCGLGISCVVFLRRRSKVCLSSGAR